MTLSATFAWLMPLVAAPFIGSFIALVAHRLPIGEPIFLGRSACRSCGAKLGPRDLIPLVSWLATRGRCRHCGVEVSASYPLTEAAALVVAIWSVSVLNGWPVIVGCCLGWTLLTLSLIDWRTRTLPDTLTWPLAVVGLVAAALLPHLDFTAHLIGTAAGLTLFWAVAAIFRRLRGYEGLGGGDAKLFAAAGAWLGWQGLPSVLLIASISALVVVFIVIGLKRRNIAKEEIAFGPYLCFGFWIVWLYGPLALV